MSNTETEIKDNRNRRGGAVGGIILILIGTGLILRRMNLDIPYWIFSWQMLLIVLGLVIGFKHSFRGGGWLAMLMVGGIFLAGEILSWPYNTAQFIWPVVLIVIGVVVVLKRNSDFWAGGDHRKQWRKIGETHSDTAGNSGYSYTYTYNYNSGESFTDDVINTSAIFSGVNKLVMSKNFKGGTVSSVFGGADINLSQADIQDTAVLDVTAIFGGCEIVVPSNWIVKTDVTTILGGVEDKRSPELMRATTQGKTLIIKGSCIFGGVEIKSYI
ncbi:MAG: hypothetical protein JO154_22900 [Chitinophaga sp.]|uniref:LiaF transmembrane domain-containing protein n=1 Tax=Chitinophaga sp. TaxID=1869181 RepID=UPI0025C4372B|nr:LiaF domain-containing protein [Chitinophaga sp.]MBV8255464.1 hypothetical protein [Chitinophaga sp.]